jgi:hypothetical protein
MITDIPAEPLQADKDGSSLDDHLWIPEPESEEHVVVTPQASGSSSLLSDRLYVGNIHPAVDELVLPLWIGLRSNSRQIYTATNVYQVRQSIETRLPLSQGRSE